ncbi:DUF11 domain-containing protein [Patescibacteria group bacterium]|nr:DUF11 domain-containing protein [Patescibacteria group bacterium]
MLRGKIRNHRLKKIFSVSVVTLFILATAMVGCSFGKSLYVIADMNAWPDVPVNAYNIEAGGYPLSYQTTHLIEDRDGGPVGIAIYNDPNGDGDFSDARLFVTYEFSDTLTVFKAEDLDALSDITATGASDLAGIVVDQGKKLVYCVDRETQNLYVYDADTFTPQGTLPIVLGTIGGEGAYGIAIDETNGWLFVAQGDNTVHYFDTSTWNEVGTITVDSTKAVGIAYDPYNRFVYTGGGWWNDDLLAKYDMSTGTATSVDLSQIAFGMGAMGLAVDPATHLLYITTGYDEDDMRVFDSDLNQVYVHPVAGEYFGDPSGICIPTVDISYNPLHFSKDDGLEYPDECVAVSGNITYTLSYDNLANPATVHTVTITDTLPAEVTFVSATGSYTYEASTRTVTWDIGTLPASDPGGSVQLVVNVTPSTTPGITITNPATIDSDDTPPTTQNEETKVCSGCVPPIPANIIVYPNPCYYPNHDKVYMINLPINAKVYIYTVSGELIRTLDDEVTSDGCSATAIWDLKNEVGEMSARGIYVYFIPEANKKIGKIAIVK